MRIAERMSRLGTETAFEVLAAARLLEAQGRDIVHLEIGEPDFPTPDFIIEAAHRAMQEGQTHYGPAAGLPDLREAIAEHVSRTRQVEVSPEQVVVTPGAKPIIFYSVLALIEKGDEVIIPDPGFPIYESVVRFVKGVPVMVPLRERLGFRWDLDELRAAVTPRTRMIILNSPHNPTGAVLTDEDLHGIADLALRHDLIVLADEIYSEILYEGTHKSILSIPGMAERTILLDGFSKTFAMTGWRLGYGVMPVELAPHVIRLIINSVSCTATFTQWAGLAALRGPRDEVHQMVEAFRKRRDFIVDGLNRIEGITCHRPQGAFYVFPNVQALGLRSGALATKLLREYGVAVLSGTAFGAAGEGYLRISYAASLETLQKGLERIRQAARDLRTRRSSAGS